MKTAAAGRIPAVVLGGGITALGTARVLGQAGIPVLCADNRQDLVRWSRWASPLPGLTSGSMPPADLSALLKPALPDGAVLVPCSDPWALVVAELCQGGVCGRFHASTSPPQIIETLIDKDGLREHLARLDIAHPLTIRATRDTDLEAALREFPAGAFLKPADSTAFFDRFGVKGMHFAGAEEGLARLRTCLDHGLEMLVQDYIPGPPTGHVFVDGFRSAREGETRLLARRRLRMFPPDFGNSTAMVTIPLDEARPAAEAIRSLVEALDYRGIFSAEFKQDPRDGAFRLLEVNARAWWYVEYAARCGLPTPLYAYLDALLRPLPAATPYRVGVRGTYPQSDFEAWRLEPGRRLADLARRAASWSVSVQPVWCRQDPLPAVVDHARLARRALWRRLRGLGRARRPD